MDKVPPKKTVAAELAVLRRRTRTGRTVEEMGGEEIRFRRGRGEKAIKCDMCAGIKGGPACVRACPTGAAIRVAPEEFLTVAKLESEDA